MAYFENLIPNVHPLDRNKVLSGLDDVFHATYIQTTPARQLFPENKQSFREYTSLRSGLAKRLHKEKFVDRGFEGTNPKIDPLSNTSRIRTKLICDLKQLIKCRKLKAIYE